MKKLLTIVVTVFILSASTAFAADSTIQGYGGSGGNTIHQVKKPSKPKEGSLPLTGFDLIALLAVGMALVGLGVGIKLTSGRINSKDQ